MSFFSRPAGLIFPAACLGLVGILQVVLLDPPFGWGMIAVAILLLIRTLIVWFVTERCKGPAAVTARDANERLQRAGTSVTP
jgi:hypothetical protein